MTRYGEVINQLQNENKTLLRKKENTLKKIVNAELAITFNETCIRENLLPIYTLNIHGDGAVNHSRRRRRRPTNQERTNFMKTRVRELQDKIQELRPLYQELEEKWINSNIAAELKENLDSLFCAMIDQHRNSISRANQNKLIKLNGGQIRHARSIKGYVNLTSKSLTSDQEELLNLGLNCHMLSKPRKFQKRTECEILLDDVERLVSKGDVTIESTFKQEVIAEASKTRGSHKSKIVEKRHIDAAKQLKSDLNITIRRADKAATFVIINTSEYHEKIDSILSDNTKFTRITRDPTEALKVKVNKLIRKNNANSSIKFERLTGEYGMGYCYGNIKTHKPGNKLRPIISQIPTPTYSLAKRLCTILTPYVPATYSLQSTSDFLDILKINNAEGEIASLDVESLFTNVPVDRTIDYICNRVYRDDTTPPLDITEPLLRELLECCTKEAPFTCPRGQKYRQIDGVAMGSPLGVLLANFFMGSIEAEVFTQHQKPDIYCRYIDDIFIKTKDRHEAERLRLLLQETSGLSFTAESSSDNTMPFLDVLVNQDGDSFNTQVFVKPSNPGHCLNGKSECPQRYKDSTIGAYIRRALTHCSTWKQVHEEIERSTQVLVNNGFSDADVKRCTKKIIDKWYNSNNTPGDKEDIVIFYKAFFSTAYKEEERIMKQIVSRNVKPTSPDKKVKLHIYYNNKKTSHLLLKNSPAQKNETTQKSHVVYKFSCKRGNCEVLNNSYIGMTTTKLSRRLTFHLAAGAPKKHLREEHGTQLTREILEENTEILEICGDSRRLAILEALYIIEMDPKLNIQADDLKSLPSIRRAAGRSSTFTTPQRQDSVVTHEEGGEELTNEERPRARLPPPTGHK